jgi:hypothetical protein
MISPAAMATKARLKALSQATNGSLFVKDERNVYLNPASVHELENVATFEWGTKTATIGAAPAEPIPEGLAIYKTDNFQYAVGLGRTGDGTKDLVAVNSAISSGITFFPQTALDVIIGGGTGEYKWGGGVHYARTTYDKAAYPKNTARELTLSGGLLTARWNGYAKLGLIGETSNKTSASVENKIEGKMSFEVGGKYDLDQVQAVGGKVNRGNASYDNGAGAKGDVTGLTFEGYYYRVLAARGGGSVFGVAGLKHSDVKISPSTGPSTTSTVLTSPVGVGFEQKALSWLALRASVTQNVLIDQTKASSPTAGDEEKLNPESTEVAAGFTTYLADNLQLDATFEGATSGGKVNGTLLAADVAVLYRF